MPLLCTTKKCNKVFLFIIFALMFKVSTKNLWFVFALAPGTDVCNCYRFSSLLFFLHRLSILMLDILFT